MKVKTEEREGLFKALVVEIEGHTVEKALSEVYKNLQEKVEIQGFRRGTAPLWLIKARYKDYIQEEVGKRIANETLQEAINESELNPVADIYLEKIELEEGIPKITYTVSFEIPPEFELADVENLEVTVPKLEFSPKLVEERIKALREEHAIWEPVESREIKEGDFVAIEYEVVERGEEGEKVSGEMSGVVGTNVFRKEVNEALIGKKVGDGVSLEEVPLYDTEGKEIGKADIKIRIKEVKEKILPEIGDDFAKELGYDNWEEAKKEIEKQAKESFESMKETVIRDAVALKLVEVHKIDVPTTLLRRELGALMERGLEELRQFGIDTRYLDYRTLAQELRPTAESNIKLRYILEKYAKEKGLEVSKEDIEKYIEKLAKDTGVPVEEMKERIEKENLGEVLKGDVLREKALKDITSKVRIKEEEKDEESAGSDSG